MYQCNAAMAIFKELAGQPGFKSPRDVANKIKESVAPAPFIEKVCPAWSYSH
jgi:hypothetical protein